MAGLKGKRGEEERSPVGLMPLEDSGGFAMDVEVYQGVEDSVFNPLQKNGHWKGEADKAVSGNVLWEEPRLFETAADCIFDDTGIDDGGVWEVDNEVFKSTWPDPTICSKSGSNSFDFGSSMQFPTIPADKTYALVIQSFTRVQI